MVSTFSSCSRWLILLCVCQFVNCQTCYWPNGMVSDFKQCSTNGGACCYNPDNAHHDPCFSNGLCQSIFFGYIYRGACTDSSWGASCPNVCTSGTPPSPLSPYHISLPSNSHQHLTNVTKQVNDDQVLLRYCSPWHAYCCQNTTSTADCCASGVGFAWNNATWINYKFVQQQDDFTFDLTSAYTTASTPKSASTAVTTTTAASTSGTTSACSTVGPTNTAKCSNNSTVAIGAGLGAGLGVPLLIALAAILWLAARRKYEQPQTPVPVASRFSTPEMHMHGYNEGSGAGFTRKSGPPVETGYGRAELGGGERS
jgi:hypothetical protein